MFNYSITTAFALTVALAAAPAFAQSTTPSQQAPSEQPSRAAQPTMVSGELVSVDAAAKSLTVKTSDNAEVKIAYDDKTDISGAKDGAAGLATMKSSRVTVHYSEDAQTKAKLATKIVVEPKK
jgi:hypothetical protein